MSMTSSLRLDIKIMFDHDRTSSGHYLRKCQKCFDILVFLFISNLRGLHGLPRQQELEPVAGRDKTRGGYRLDNYLIID